MKLWGVCQNINSKVFIYDSAAHYSLSFYFKFNMRVTRQGIYYSKYYSSVIEPLQSNELVCQH